MWNRVLACGIGCVLSLGLCVGCSEPTPVLDSGFSDGGEGRDAGLPATLARIEADCLEGCGERAECNVSSDGSFHVIGHCRLQGSSVAALERYETVVLHDDLRLGESDQEDLELRTVRRIEGSLRVQGPFAGLSLSLPNLSYVGSFVTIPVDEGLKSLSVAELQEIEGGVDIEAAVALEELDFSLLQTVGDDVRINGNPDLQFLLIGRLNTVNGDLEITNNLLLDGCALKEELEDVQIGGDLSIVGNSTDACPADGGPP